MEVLLSAMFLESWEYINTLNITTDVTIINQCDVDNSITLNDSGRRIQFISSTQRGLSRSRNMAIRNARDNICIICDNDIEYVKDYSKIIMNAYSRHPDADVIVFFLKKGKNSRPYKNKEGRLGYKTALMVGSPEITFKIDSLKKHNISFKEEFGAGSEYMMGEESIFLYECLRKGLNIYYVPIKIADLRYEESTWKSGGRNKKFFMDKGACYYAMTGWFSSIMNLQFVIRKRKLYEISPLAAFKYMQEGSRKYKESKR